ncbi:14107_t:CDS:2 [Funneliformis geosporum]|nr:14107_t:CDS:2 [Funneliformis geosporum]
MKKRFTFPPQEEMKRVLKRIARPGYRRVNIGLLPDATEADKVKYHLCLSISRYQDENNLPEKELANKLGIIIGEQRFTKLEISPDYQEKNKEFDLILKLVQQLDDKSKQEVKYEGSYYQYDYYTYEPGLWTATGEINTIRLPDLEKLNNRKDYLITERGQNELELIVKKNKLPIIEERKNMRLCCLEGDDKEKFDYTCQKYYEVGGIRFPTVAGGQRGLKYTA